MDSPIAALLAEILERLAAVENARRAAYTTIRNGKLVITNDDGEEAIAFGMDESGNAFIRVMNSDGSAPVFEVSAGDGIFPPAVAPWAVSTLTPINAQGRPTNTLASWATMMWAILPITSPEVDLGVFIAALSAGTCDWRITAVPRNTRPGHSIQSIVIASQTGYTGGPIFTSPVTIPPSIWSPASNPVGSVVLLQLHNQITSGGGTASVGAIDGAMCV